MEWIDVNERVPTQEEMQGFVLIAYLEWDIRSITVGIHLGKKWISEIGARKSLRPPKQIVTHWAPFPKFTEDEK